MITIEKSLELIQKLLGVGFETKIRILRMEAAAGRRMDSDLHDDQRRSERTPARDSLPDAGIPPKSWLDD